jgi:hypothetical protein
MMAVSSEQLELHFVKFGTHNKQKHPHLTLVRPSVRYELQTRWSANLCCLYLANLTYIETVFK